MIVLDTTVLVYASGASHPLREPCRRLMRAVARGELAASTTVEVIQEYAHVRARRRGRQEAAEQAERLQNQLMPLLTTGESDLSAGLRLFTETERLGMFDCVLATAAKHAGAAALVSADRGFAEVSGLEHVLPSDAAIEGLLRG